MSKLIAFTGYIGNGKSTAAGFLKDFERIAFADPIKEALMCFGLHKSQVYGDEKEMPITWLDGITPRRLMQTLGTEWARDIIHKDFWVFVAEAKIKNTMDLGFNVVVDDLRFPNEAKMIKKLGGMIIRVERYATSSDLHPSEIEVNNFESDFYLLNKGSLDKFKSQVVETVDWLYNE